MVIAYPWTGRDWNRGVTISGRAAMPGLPGGSGFNFRSVMGTTGFLRPQAMSGLSGLGRMRRLFGLRRRGVRGLGQTDIYGNPISTGGDVIDSGYPPNVLPPVDVFVPPSSTTTDTNPYYQILTQGGVPLGSTAAGAAQGNSSSSSSITSLLQSLVGVGSQITNYQLNPLTNKQTYIQTPQGIVATNAPVSSITTQGTALNTGLTSTAVTSMLPLLMLGGGAVVLMMMMSRR